MVRARLTYANVVATLALFVALGGSSYAALTITGKNVKNSSLTGKDVKNSSLTGRDVKNSSLTTSDVRNRSLLARDFKTGQLPAGPPGAPGAPGSARAYAHVLSNGTLDTAHSKNVDRVLQVGSEPGLYCVNFTIGAPNAIVVTIEGIAGQSGALSGEGSCNVGQTYNAQVFTANFNGAGTNSAFYLLAN